MKKFRIPLLVMMLALSGAAYSQTGQPVTEYLNAPGPFTLANSSYELVWSAHPAKNYYKQEYLVRGDNVNRYKAMILLEAVTGNADIKTIVDAKVEELKKLEAANPVVNYEILDNSAAGEYMIDFVLSKNSPDGKYTELVERNVYRYKTFTDRSGKTGVVLFGVSTRAYGDSIYGFFTGVKANREDLVNKVSAFPIPDISILK